MKPESTATLIAAFNAMFVVLCLVCIDNSRLNSLRSQQKIELSKLGLTSIAPDNLPRSAELLRLSLPLQDRSISSEALAKLPAWKKFQETVFAYAERLKLMNQQSQELDERLWRRALWTSVSALVVTFINLCLVLWNRRRVPEILTA